ncbi:HET-domain-containing protein [Phaeosphaeriaceae sp. SRC1lsM3a]|nr:HET-domain-containing protein [Stagonospora sp. SRC1lsM3a]
MASANELCTQCQRIDIASLFRKALGHQQALDIGPLEEIIAKEAECAFCATVVASFQAQQPWTRSDAARTLRLLHDDGDSTDVHLYSYVFMTDATPLFRLGVSTNKDNKTNRRGRYKHAGDLQIMQSSATRLGIPEQGRGRRMQPTTNMALARNWLDECLENHDGACSRPGSEPSHSRSALRPTKLRVIDVRERCLVSLPLGAEYVALSYCWPKEPGLCNLSTNAVNISAKGTITTFNGLSSNIDDACNAVHDLNERYLWVDALCIVQDSSEDKGHQIGQMDLVYGNALLTIVIASDTRNITSFGLPGYLSVPAARSQAIHTIYSQGVELAVPKPCLEDILAYTKWETRGWTFQESHISRRSLYFTDHQLYFQCSCGVRCEDTANEKHSPGAYIRHSTNIWNPKNAHATSEDDNYGEVFLSRTEYTSENEALGMYDTLVSAYLRRELSFRSDILNAFTGIEKVLSSTMKTGFYAGLPLKWLDHALLWQLYGSDVRHNDFPSFSWAGWQGGAEAPYWLAAGDTRRLLTWYRYEEERWIDCDEIRRITIEQPADFTLRIPWLDTSTLNVTALETPWCLAAMTQTATFRLSSFAAEIVDAVLWPDSDHVWIMDARQRRAGLILIPRAWVAKNATQDDGHDFILLSQARQSRIDDMPNFDDAHYEQKDWCLVNVMLVKWRDDGLAERVAVGVVHYDAWKEARFATKVVKLY